MWWDSRWTNILVRNGWIKIPIFTGNNNFWFYLKAQPGLRFYLIVLLGTKPTLQRSRPSMMFKSKSDPVLHVQTDVSTLSRPSTRRNPVSYGIESIISTISSAMKRRTQSRLLVQSGRSRSSGEGKMRCALKYYSLAALKSVHVKLVFYIYWI